MAEDGVSTFFRSDRFDLVEEVIVEYNVGRTHLDRDNVALILVLLEKQAGAKVIVANTHILFNPDRGETIAAPPYVCSSG